MKPDAGPPPCPPPEKGPGPGLHKWADAGECVGIAPQPDTAPAPADPLMLGALVLLALVRRLT